MRQSGLACAIGSSILVPGISTQATTTSGRYSQSICRVSGELARLLAEVKEEGAEEGACKVKEDWGDVDEKAW